jgi:hypothetical protein
VNEDKDDLEGQFRREVLRELQGQPRLPNKPFDARHRDFFAITAASKAVGIQYLNRPVFPQHQSSSSKNNRS